MCEEIGTSAPTLEELKNHFSHKVAPYFVSVAGEEVKQGNDDATVVDPLVDLIHLCKDKQEKVLVKDNAIFMR